MTTPSDLVAQAAAAIDVDDIEPLKQGGQKLVFRGTRRGVPVVLKVVLLQRPFHSYLLERARREVGLLAAIDSANVVKVMSDLVLVPTDVSTPNEALAAAWIEEELDGSDLSDLVGHQWGWDDVEFMLREVAAGLQELHGRKVIHRDLSPGNVRRLDSGRWKVMDPGLAKHLAESSITGFYQPGTPGFMSPEHVPGSSGPNPSSDVFALGILAFLALSNDLPISTDGGEAEYYRRLREEQCRSIGTVRVDLSGPQQALVDRMLRRQSARRFLDATELLEGLKKLAGN